MSTYVSICQRNEDSVFVLSNSMNHTEPYVFQCKISANCSKNACECLKTTRKFCAAVNSFSGNTTLRTRETLGQV